MKSYSMFAYYYRVRSSILALFCLLLLLGNAAYAAADWEWTMDKGWSQTTGRALPNPAEQLKYAYKLEKEGKYLSASQQYFLLLKAFPDSEEAGVGLQRLANCLFLMENYYDAYKALEQVIKSYPFSAEKSDLIKIEFLIGRKFQEGARVNLLDDYENPTIGKRVAIEIFESVIENDPVGPYAGASLLAIASCYKDLDEPARGIVYADRVLTEFSMSTELVAKARILKKTMEVMQGDADINSVRVAVNEAKKAAAESEDEEGLADTGSADFAPVDDYDSEIRELEEIQAKKLWDSAEFYQKRGTRDSMVAYKFSLEQIMVRFPNTSYASKARRIIGDVKIPEKKDSAGEFNIPFITKKAPTFITASNSDDYVHTDDVPVPGIDSDFPEEDALAATSLPKGRDEVPMGEEYASVTSKRISVTETENDGKTEEQITEDTTETDFVDPTMNRTDNMQASKQEVKLEVEEEVVSQPVPMTQAPTSPVGSGATAVPLAATRRAQTTSLPASQLNSPIPESLRNKTSASAVPVSIRQSSTIIEEAQSSARVKANEVAAESNDWSFSEEF